VRLRYTREALAELAQVLDGIREHSPQGARRVRSRISEVAALLAEHPYTGQRTSHPTLRRIVVVPYPYLIFYHVTEAGLIIVGVRHAARDPAATPDVP
jgi:toxin ParE1/3/4